MRVEPGGGAREEVGVPGVIVIVQGEVFAGGGVQSLLRAAAATKVLRQVNGADFVAQGGGLGGEQRVYPGGVATIVDDVRLPVGAGLRGDVGEGAGEEGQAVFAADDDGDFGHGGCPGVMTGGKG